jgi:hypothetical protein
MKLDELMPYFDVRARYETRVDASPERARRALREVDFSQMPLTRLLMGLRTLGWRRRKARASLTPEERLRASGFVPIPTGSEEETLMGVVGRFWRPDSGVVHGLTAEGIVAFEKPGYAKALWNFTVTPEPSGGTRLATETRVLALGNSARWKFRTYWFVVGPLSGLIRKEMLRRVKQRAEGE